MRKAAKDGFVKEQRTDYFKRNFKNGKNSWGF